jgi:hypothetical protein
VDIPREPTKYVNGSSWAFGQERERVMTGRTDARVSVIVCDPDHFTGFVTPSRPWLSAERLSVSPVFETAPQNGKLLLCRRPQYGRLPNFAPPSFAELPTSMELTTSDDANQLLRLCCDGILVLLPRNFGLASTTLAGCTD